MKDRVNVAVIGAGNWDGEYHYKQKYALKKVDPLRHRGNIRFSTLLRFLINNILSGLRAYKLSRKKTSFFIPLFVLIRIIARKFGEIKAYSN